MLGFKSNHTIQRKFILTARWICCIGILIFINNSYANTTQQKISNQENESKNYYILFLTSDGFRSDYIDWYNPPNLKKLISEGTRVLNSRTVFPSVTTPNMTSLVTGSYPKTTGIACNTQYVKELDKLVGGPRDNKAETITESLQKAGWKTASVNHFMLENRGVDIYRSPGYADSEKTTDEILDILTTGKAQFIAAIYGVTDKVGHEKGPYSEEIKQAVLGIDTQIGRLIETLKEMGIYEKTIICFNADHGMSIYGSYQSSDEPATVLKNAGYKVAVSQSEISDETQIIVVSAGVRLVYFRKVLNDTEKSKIQELLSQIKGAFVLNRTQLDELNCHPERSGDLIVSPLPGFVMSDAGNPGGLHGRFTEQNPVCIFAGPGIKKGYRVIQAENVDIVPTLLNLVNIEPANTVDGKVIQELIVNK